MRARPLLTLLLLVSVTAADLEPVRLAWEYARRLQGPHQRKWAASRAPLYEGKVFGKDLLYLGYLWRYAHDWEKAELAFHSYALQVGPGAPQRGAALYERLYALVEMGKWNDVLSESKRFLQERPKDPYAGRVHFLYGRARRVRGFIKQALGSFRASAALGYEIAHWEVVDCLMHLGRYDEAVAAAPAKSPRTAVLKRALPHLGKPWPKLPIEFWTDGKRPESKVRAGPVLFLFWSTKARRARDLIHEYGNALANVYGKRVQVIGPATYLSFDPVLMKHNEDLTSSEEQAFVEAWYHQYELKFPLALIGDGTLHDWCGIDPERPLLPAYAIGDADGNFRYVRLGGGAWALEGVAAMLDTITKSKTKR